MTPTLDPGYRRPDYSDVGSPVEVWLGQAYGWQRRILIGIEGDPHLHYVTKAISNITGKLEIHLYARVKLDSPSGFNP